MHNPFIHVTAAEVCIIVSVVTEVWGGTRLSPQVAAGSLIVLKGDKEFCVEHRVGWDGMVCISSKLQHVY